MVANSPSEILVSVKVLFEPNQYINPITTEKKVNEKAYTAQYSLAHSYENWSPYRYRIPWTIKSILDIKQKNRNIEIATATPFDALDIKFH